MKLSEKLKRIEKLEKEIKTIQHNANRESGLKWKPLSEEANDLKNNIYKESKTLIKDIEKDMKDFIKRMKKKYKKLNKLEIESDVLYFGTNVETSVYFEISLENIIKYEEGKRKKIKKKIVRDKEDPKETLREKAKRLAEKRKGKK